MMTDLMVHLSADVTDRMAAASLRKGVSASVLLHEVARVGPGMTILVRAAAGGIGQILVPWARALGARVIVTSSTADKVALVRALGATHVIDRAGADPAAVGRGLTGGGASTWLLAARGAPPSRARWRRSPYAAISSVSARRRGRSTFRVIDRLAARSITLSRPNDAHDTDTPERLGPDVERFFGAVRAGQIRLAEPTPSPRERAADAHPNPEARTTIGPLVPTF